MRQLFSVMTTVTHPPVPTFISHTPLLPVTGVVVGGGLLTATAIEEEGTCAHMPV